jgi:putative transposase
MKRTRFTEEQIIRILKEADSGAKTGEPARRHGVSKATIDNGNAKYGGLEVVRSPLKALEQTAAICLFRAPARNRSRLPRYAFQLCRPSGTACLQ